MNIKIPNLRTDFLCIVNRHCPEIAAVISSYLNETGCYLPMFEMPNVTATRPSEPADEMNEHSFSRDRAEHQMMDIRQVIAQLDANVNIVLAGLTAEQRSFLKLPADLNCIDVIDIDEVDFYLSPFFSARMEYLTCTSAELLQGLYAARQGGYWLRIDEQAQAIQLVAGQSSECVIIEDNRTASAVIAANYAVATAAHLVIVDSLRKKEHTEIIALLEDWKENGDQAAYQEIADKVTSRLGSIDITKFDCATFFTTGLPYSLVLGNPIPCCYVHLGMRPDQFIFYNILLEGETIPGGAVLFSPQAFEDEEIDYVRTALQDMHYYIRELIGAGATAYAMSRAIQFFPYSLLHICSHGGEIRGRRIEHHFIDSEGGQHTVVYDGVLSFAPIPGYGKIEVALKAFPRSIDGVKMHSKELEAMNYPHHVFSDMYNSILRGRRKEDKLIEDIQHVQNSCSIQCYDFSFQGIIKWLAGGIKPIIFNNSCQSWSRIAGEFLYAGCRGYIGTLWNVGNNKAIAVATEFYRITGKMSICEALHHAGKNANGSKSENGYIYWGLPFTTLPIGVDNASSRAGIYQLLYRQQVFLERYFEEKENVVNENLQLQYKWHIDEINIHFTATDYDQLFSKFMSARRTRKQ